MKLHQLTEIWLTEKKREVKESTFYLYKYCVNKYLIPNLGAYSLKKLHLEDIQQCFDFLLSGNNPLKNSTAKNLLMILRQMLKYAAGRGLMKSFLVEVKMEGRKSHLEPETFDINEQKKLMENLKSRGCEGGKRICVMLSLSLGLRIGEVCALKWKDIDFSRGVLNVRGTVQRVNGRILLGSPKTAKSLRTLPIPDEMLKILKKNKKKTCIESQEIFLLTSSLQPAEPRTLRRFFHDFCRKNKIRPLKYHCLRHSFATRCIEKGIDCKTVSEILGHASVSTTLNLYAHPSMEAKRKCVNMVKLL